MELFIQSIVVYGFIIFVMTNAGLYTYRHQYPNGFISENNPYNKKSSFIDLFTKSHFLIPLLVYCFFVTVRERVGADCESYKQSFYNLLYGYDNRETIEQGFTSLIKFTLNFTDKHYLMFLIMGFSQIGALYYAMRKEGYLLIFFGITLFFTDTFFSLMNGMRQNITACIFVAMTALILNKKYWLWVIPITIITITMHRSALAIIPVGILGYICKDKIPNKYIQLAIVSVCLLFMDKVDYILPMELLDFGEYSGYSQETIEHYAEYSIREKNFGFRSYLLLFSHIIIILYSNRLKEFYNSNKFNYIYCLFFVRVCLFLLFYNNFVVIRLLFFVNLFVPIMQAYLLFYLWYNKSQNNKLIFSSYIFILIVHFLYQLYVSVVKFPYEVTLYKFDL